MRRVLSLFVGMVMVVASVPVSALAAETAAKQQGATLTGVARGADNAPLSHFTVRLRSADRGDLIGSTRTNQAGEYTFTRLAPGNYVVEIVDEDGKIVGMSPSINLPAGAAVSVTVNATGALAAGGKGGFGLFGLGKLASVAVIGAGGALAVAGVVATRDDASPSR